MRPSAQSVVDSGQATSPWPRYSAATLGLRNYWYPVAWSRKVGDRPFPLKLCGETIMLIRKQGRVFGLSDQCPHRGVPLSLGREEFTGTWTCCYHAWTFDLETGVLKAALTDGPDSALCGRIAVKTYPVAERAGLVWVYVGELPPPPVEADIPQEFLYPNSVVVGRISIQNGDWRFACENGYDAGHASYLHRYGAWETMFSEMGAWRLPKVSMGDDGFLVRESVKSGASADYPGLGHWPQKKSFWKIKWPGRAKGHRTAIRLPGILRIDATHYRHARWIWWTPVDEGHYRMLQFFTIRASGLGALRFRLNYALHRKPVHHIQFNNQDARIVAVTHPTHGPKALYRPDVSITSWRSLCDSARGLEHGANGHESRDAAAGTAGAEESRLAAPMSE